ncbi:MAG: citrate synthase [Sedimentisphaerales bacterium]|nr:citrate synthase [Sedimentisphaerales bacterium]
MNEKAVLRLGDQDYPLVITVGSEGEKAIDISSLRADTGYITLDPGFANTGACESGITFIQGDQGILRYRGIPIEQLVQHSRFIETAYLLIWGELPTPKQMDHFSSLLTQNEMLHENMKHHFEGFPWTSHPMAMLSAMINALSCYHPVLSAPSNPSQVEQAAATLMSKVRTLVAFSYKMVRGEPFIYPSPKRRYVSNLLHMMFSQPEESYEPSPVVTRAVDRLLILHADHEQNCSTSTVRMVASSGANLFASVSAGICALWGPRHGGANQAVIEMLEEIHAGGMDARQCVELAKKKDSGFRLMGFGHRVYKNYDPRARIIKSDCDKVLEELGCCDPLLEIARELEEIALRDEYFIERKLYPNVDFYSGIILRAVGVPKNMFPVFFAIGRLPGWIAHWRETTESRSNRIDRPRQVYTGPNERQYVPLEQRC